jgi:cation diffusion facilitator CzcD-associated flavoprotein CzcO
VTSFAIVGGGFAGVGAAVMLRREGYQDLTRVRARRADRRRLELQHLSRRSLRRAVAPLRVLVCPEPEVVAPLCAPGRDPAYVEDVARSHGVLDRIRTGTEVLQARWESDRAKWLLETSAGLHEADVLLTACGQLSVPSVPPLPGLGSFSGPSFHTARWPEDVDVAGKRVAVIGTGCSAIQVGPAIQSEVQQLDIYQRSPG